MSSAQSSIAPTECPGSFFGPEVGTGKAGFAWSWVAPSSGTITATTCGFTTGVRVAGALQQALSLHTSWLGLVARTSCAEGQLDACMLTAEPSVPCRTPSWASSPKTAPAPGLAQSTRDRVGRVLAQLVAAVLLR